MNEITRYQNKLNTVRFKGFGKVDSNLFFTICAKTKYHGTEPIRMTFKEIRALSGFTEHSNEALIKALDQSYRKMLDLNIRLDSEDGSGDYTVFALFHRFDMLISESAIEVRATEELQEILNEWTGGEWTAFRLDEYVALKSTYSKHMYRLLKQWRTLGGHSWKIGEWRELLEVPENYDMKQITQRVLAPITKELPEYFIGLNIEKIKTGRTVTALRFTFQAEDENYGDYTKQPDLKNKEEKLEDISAKEEKGPLNVKQIALKDNLTHEKVYLDKNGLPDTHPEPPKRKGILSRFFK